MVQATAQWETMEDDLVKRLRDTIEHLKAEVFRLKSVIENLPGSIYWKDRNGKYLGRNIYSMEKMQSVQLEHNGIKDAIIGKTDYDFFPKDAADRYRKHDMEVMETRKELSVEEPITLPNGKTLIQLSTKRPLYNEQGNVIGIVGNTVDITHLKEIEEELRQAKEKAEQADLTKTEFMRNMEHDIRTPFTGAWAMAESLYKKETNADKKEMLGDISRCTNELLSYCNKILDWSKIEKGGFPIVAKKFKLKSLITSVINMEIPAAKDKHLQLKMTYDTCIPLVLLGDDHRLLRVLINLVGNAIRFTEKGYINLNVSQIEKKGKSVLIRFVVEDTGIGIPADKHNYIFEKFTRLSPSNKGVYKGLGVGLSIVKQFMQDMEGEIDVVSKEGKGTQFICTIPFKLPLTNDFVEE